MGDGAGNLDGEAEVGRRGVGPALPGLAQVGAVEAGVDLDAVEAVGVALEVGELVGSGWRKGGCVVLGEGPAGSADVDVAERGRVGCGGIPSGFHHSGFQIPSGTRVGVSGVRRILLVVPQPAVKWLGCRA